MLYFGYMALSPTGLIRAGWASTKQNIGVFILYSLSITGLTLAAGLLYVLLSTVLGTSTIALALSALLGVIGYVAGIGYVQMTGTRLAYFGSAGTRVALREVLAWNASVVGRMIGLYLLYFLFGALGALPVLLVMALSMAVNSSVLPVLAVVGVVAYVVFAIYFFCLVIALQVGCFLVLQGSAPWAALRSGWVMTAGSRWRLLGYYVLLGLFLIAVMLPPILITGGVSLAAASGSGSLGLGAIVSFLAGLYIIAAYIAIAAIALFSMGHVYRQLGGK